MRPTLVLLLMVVWIYAKVSGWTLGGREDVLPVLAIVIGLFRGREGPPAEHGRHPSNM